MTRPIENCPVEEKPMRNRAYTDRQLLELAARAVGYDYRPQNDAIVEDGIPARWNPLTGEKAGPAGEGVCDERKEYPDGSGYLQVAFADGVPELLGRSVRVSPTSPAPDKEGQP